MKRIDHVRYDLNKGFPRDDGEFIDVIEELETWLEETELHVSFSCFFPLSAI